MKKINKKIVASLLILILSFSFLPQTTLADSFNWPSPPTSAKEAMNAVMEQFGFNKESLAENVQTFNVLNNKKQNPQMMVTFSPTNPNPGEKVTATAAPMYFGNSGDSLYYTWYIKHKDGDNKDLDGDGEIGIEDYKIAAARIIASDGYDYQRADYNNTINNSGYNAIFGGDDQKGKNNHCFFYDVTKGAEYEFEECGHLFPKYHTNKEGCPSFSGDDAVGNGTFSDAEECFWQTNPANPDTAGLGQTDEANVVGLGTKSFTWTYQEGDQVGVAIEGVSYIPTAYADSSYKIMWALSKNKCDPTCDIDKNPNCDPETGMLEKCDPDKDENCNSETGLIDGDKELLSVEPAVWPDCPDGCTFPRTIKTKETKYSQAPSSSYKIATSTTKTISQIIQLSARKYTAGGVEGGDGGDGGTDGSGGQGGTGGSAELGPGICDSPSPQELDKEVDGEVVPGCYTVDGISGILADGTSITDRSCCPPDGLSIEAVEEGCPLTQTSCSILSNNASSEDNTAADTTMTPVKEGDGNLFQMNMDQFNQCLLQNFVDPANSNEDGTINGGGGANKKLDVSLSYSPKNPINVPLPPIDSATGERRPDIYAINADEVNVEAMMDNAKDSEFLNYTWEVYRGDSPSSEEGEWGYPLSKSQLNGAGLTTGPGLKNFKFNMRFDKEGGGFLKVKLTVTENAYNGTRTGHSDVIIPIAINKKDLNVYSTTVSDNVSLTLSKDTLKCIDEETGQNLPVCEVVKNQILSVETANIAEYADAASPDNFSWTIDGEPIKNYDQDNPEVDKSTNLIFFPVTKEVGDTFDVSLAANVNPTDKNPAEKINLTRAFKVIDPKITVTSGDSNTCVPVLKGFYMDLDNVSWPDYSETEFETLNGADMKLKATFTGATPPEDQISWFVDNVLQTTPGSSLSYVGIKPVGESYSITVSSLYSQDNPTAKALLKYWGINYDGLYEKNSSTTVNVKTVGILSETTARGNVKKFLAALAAGVPSYLSFLFRLVLTTALLLFTYRVIFILLPNAKREEI